MRWIARGAAAVFAALGVAGSAAALEGDVTLTARGGGLSVSGTLRAYDGAVYRVDTAYGLLTLDASAVTCDGPGCPDLLNWVPTLTVTGEIWPGAAALTALVADFAQAAGASLLRTDEPGGGFSLSVEGPGRAGIVRIRFAPRNEAAAAAALAAAEADLALLARPPGGAEGRLLALDALVPVAWPGNPVRRLSLRDLRAVQAGAITNWADLGGPDMPIVVHAFRAGSGLQAMVEARLGGPPPDRAVRHDDPAALAAAVARDPWALALMPASQAAGLASLVLADTCGHVIRPSRFAVKAEDYPLALAIHLAAPRRRLPAIARALIDHAATPSAQSALAEAGFADLYPEAQAATEQGGRLVNAIRAAGPELALTDLQRLAEAMASAERLSFTVRFEGGARAFDAASRSHIADLVTLIEAGAFDGQTLVFAGFSDGDGDARANLALSMARAEAARDAVAAAAPMRDPARVGLTVEAFGEALPIACDDTPLGRQINRRVEVWLRPLPAAKP